MKRKSVIALILCVALMLSGCSELLDKLGGSNKWQEQYDLGMRYLEDGDYEEAILAFSAAIEIDSSRPEAYMGRAEAYVAVNDPEKALKDYKKAKRLAKNDDEFEDLVEDLEELIEQLEELIEEYETEPENTDPDWVVEDDWNSGDEFLFTVTDAFSDSVADPYFGGTYCYHIPQINLQDNAAQDVNAWIYETLYAVIDEQVYDYIDHYGYPGCGDIYYSWTMQHGIVSVIVEKNWADWYWIDYYVYNVSVETGELVSDEELLAAYGLDRDGFYELARATLEPMFAEYSEETIGMVGQEFYDYMVSMTLSEESLSQAMPFIGQDGNLCMAAMQYGAAGADYYWHTYNLGTLEGYTMPECNADHTAGNAAYTAAEITQMAADWFNWNVGGYESGTHVAFDTETTVSGGKCYVMIRFQNSDPEYTGGANVLVTVAEVDMATGEMWSDGYFRGYLW